jgi:hypothetical protein
MHGRRRPVVGLGPVVVGTVSGMEHDDESISHRLLVYETSIGSQPTPTGYSSLAPRQHHHQEAFARAGRSRTTSRRRRRARGHGRYLDFKSLVLDSVACASTAANGRESLAAGALASPLRGPAGGRTCFGRRQVGACGLHAWPDRPAPARRASEPLIG